MAVVDSIYESPDVLELREAAMTGQDNVPGRAASPLPAATRLQMGKDAVETAESIL